MARENERCGEWIPVTSRRNRGGVRGNGARLQRYGYNVTATHGTKINRQTHGISSFMFHGFPDSWGMDVIWRVFKRYGSVSDVYMARKRLKNGSRFGFVRFKDVVNRDVFLQQLNTIIIGTSPVKVYHAITRRTVAVDLRKTMGIETQHDVGTTEPNGKNFRSYSQVLQNGSGSDVNNKSKKENDTNGDRIDLIVEEEVKKCLMRSFVGDARSVSFLVTIGEMMKIEGISDITCKHIGGLILLFECNSEEEVFEVFGKEHPLAEGISKLKTIGMIINETLRLYPPGIAIIRQNKREVKLRNLTIPANVILHVPVLALHHDRNIWGEDAHLFKPERFSEGISKATKNNPSAYMPFGFGPRNCVGSNFATNTAKVTLAMILQRYRFTPSPNYVHSPVHLLMLIPKNGVQVMLHAL